MIGDPERRRRLAELARAGAFDPVGLLRARARRYHQPGPEGESRDASMLRRRG